MIAILSPAKTLNMDRTNINSKYTQPTFIEEASELMDELRNYSPPEMESLMKINSELAELNFRRHVRWADEHNITNSKQALLAYHGAVFQGVGAGDFDEKQLDFAQQHLRILSGLYGILRPLDLVQPYRLEMGIKFRNAEGKDLYSFWKGKITDHLKKELNNQADHTLINLASNEYYSCVDIKKLNANIITPVFKEYRGGIYKMVTIYAKRARGLMTRYIIQNGIDCAEDLMEFEEEGYEFNEGISTEKKWVFTR